MAIRGAAGGSICHVSCKARSSACISNIPVQYHDMHTSMGVSCGVPGCRPYRSQYQRRVEPSMFVSSTGRLYTCVCWLRALWVGVMLVW